MLSRVYSVRFYTAKFIPFSSHGFSSFTHLAQSTLFYLLVIKCMLGIGCCCFRLEACSVGLPPSYPVVLMQSVTLKPPFLSCSWELFVSLQYIWLSIFRMKLGYRISYSSLPENGRTPITFRLRCRLRWGFNFFTVSRNWVCLLHVENNIVELDVKW